MERNHTLTAIDSIWVTPSRLLQGRHFVPFLHLSQENPGCNWKPFNDDDDDDDSQDY